MEVMQNESADVSEIEAALVDRIQMLVSNLMQNGLVKAAHNKDHQQKDDLKDYGSWIYDSKFIRKKNKTIVECFFQVCTEVSTYKLCLNQKEFCEKYSMRISTKNTDLEHTKRIGFIIGPNIQMAAPEAHVNQINAEANLDDKVIEIKKKVTFERGTSSKVLMMCALEDEANTADKTMFDTEFKRFQHVSYKLTSSKQRLASMHANEMNNEKARFETLYETQVEDKVFVENEKIALADVILSAKHNDIELFLAIEQGSGATSRHTHVVLNPQVKNKAREWLVNEHPALLFEIENNNETSVDKEQHKKQVKYSQNLNEFLAPKLSTKKAKEVKKFGGKMKTHAKAVGISIHNDKEQGKKLKQKDNTTKKQKAPTNKQRKETNDQSEIHSLKRQVAALTELLMKTCQSILKDNTSETMLKKIEEIKQPIINNNNGDLRQNQQVEIINVEVEKMNKVMDSVSENNNKIRKTPPVDAKTQFNNVMAVKGISGTSPTAMQHIVEKNEAAKKTKNSFK